MMVSSASDFERPYFLSLEVPHGEPWDSGIQTARILLKAGFQSYAAGGCVRDLLLGLPVHDIDIATAAHPEQVEEIFLTHNWRTIAVGKSFGVIIVVTPSGLNIEIATFRHDGAYIDGRRPQSITFSDVKDDVQRRDFTINALLYDVERGMVIDYVHGRTDLFAGIIRAVGDPFARLQEDRLRVLRAIRFAARLNFKIEPLTWEALKATSLIGLSGERLMQELMKALAGLGRSRWLKLLFDSSHLMNLCTPLATCHLEDIIILGHRLDELQSDDPFSLQLALWLSPLSQDSALSWLDSQRLSSTAVRTTRWLLEHAVQWSRLQSMTLATRRRLWRHADGLLLGRFIELLHGDHPLRREAVRTLVQEMQTEQQIAWKSPFRAEELIAMGLAPGPKLGALLRELDDADLEGRFINHAAAETFARARIAQLETLK
jgi:poly(A) polymerase